MEDTLKNNAEEISRSLEERKATDVVALDLRRNCSWTDVLIIATANSRVHMQGLAEAVRQRMKELDLEVSGGAKKNDQESWRIIDGGNVVVSLMDADARDFYALEELWFEAENIYPGDV